MNTPTLTTKYGTIYDYPDGLTNEKYYSLIEEFVDLTKVKGLTVRQAQCLFNDCADAVLSTKL